MRGLVHLVLLAVLLAGTCWHWNRRFEPDRKNETVALSDLRAGDSDQDPDSPWKGAESNPFIRLERVAGGAPIARKFAMPFGTPVEALFLRINVASSGLASGRHTWESSRLFVAWAKPSGEIVERDLLLNVVGENDGSRSAEMIVGSPEQGLYPLLRVEHLGRSGWMEIRSLQAVAVRERGWSGVVSGGVLLLWFGWFYSAIRWLSRTARWRSACASAILTLMVWHLAVPGPWKLIRPLFSGFDAGRSLSVAERGARGPNESPESRLPRFNPHVVPLGEMPVQDGLLVKIKLALLPFRPVLHILLFAVPSLILCVLVGKRTAVWAGVLLAIIIEGAQFAFGYGFDRIDVLDLIEDGIGIAAALVLFRVLARKWPMLVPLRESSVDAIAGIQTSSGNGAVSFTG